MIDLRLPEEALEKLPPTKNEMVQYLAPFVNEFITEYEKALQDRNLPSFLKVPPSRGERGLIFDVLMWGLLKRNLEEDTERAPTLHEGVLR
jgi:hypothetical protein